MIKNKNSNINAFTLAEMMVVLLILSIIAAALLPIITGRTKTNGGFPWKYSENRSDAYYGTGATQGAIIGKTKFETTDPSSRLLISTAALGQNHMLFKQDNAITGRLTIDGLGNVGLGAITFDLQTPTVQAAIAVGAGTQASGNDSLAIGRSASASAVSSIAIGSSPTPGIFTAAASEGNISIGAGAKTTSGGSAVAIGVGAIANDNDTTALGHSALVNGERGTAIGANAVVNVAHEDCTAIGFGAATTASRQIVLGKVIDPPAVVIPGSLSVAGTLSVGGNNVVNTAGTWTTSDKRLKNISGEFVGGLDQIRNLQTFNYSYKKDKKKTPRVGVIAQDLQKVFPSAVTKGKDGYLMIRQEDIFYAMINSIKQLDKMVQNLVAQFQTNMAKVQSLENKCKILESKNNALEKNNKLLEARLLRLEKLVK